MKHIHGINSRFGSGDFSLAGGTRSEPRLTPVAGGTEALGGNGAGLRFTLASLLGKAVEGLGGTSSGGASPVVEDAERPRWERRVFPF